MRCLALADELESIGWQTVFVTGTQSARNVSALAGKTIVAAFEELRARWTEGADVVVVDSYEIDAKVEKDLRPWARNIVAIDDLLDRWHDADVLIDQNLRTTQNHHHRARDDALVLLGPAYAILRSQFRAYRAAVLARRDGVIKRVLVSMGLADGRNATSLALAGIRESGCDVEVDVVIGSMCPHLAAIRAEAKTLKRPASIYIDAMNIAELMANADLAIGGGGTSSWERCCLGLPALIIIVADNQRAVADALADTGAVRLLGELQETTTAEVGNAIANLRCDQEAVLAMARQSSIICDGLGAYRVAAALEAEPAHDGGRVALRPVSLQDEKVLLLWQQDPSTRRFFRNPAIPTAENHANWLAQRLADPMQIFEMIVHRGEHAGFIRLDPVTKGPEKGSYEISIVVAPDRRQLGIGERALQMAKRLVPDAALIADVLAGNQASARLFKKSGYLPLDDRRLIHRSRH
jgi:UDP-2,4-diacetamido-2,4,6-trideoxy-beta-L-altropyranose hydrolase